MLLFNAAHHNAEVPCLTDHRHAARLNQPLNHFRHLLRQSLLNLQAAREGVYQPWNLTESYDLLIRQVSHMHFAEKRQHVVLAHAEELNIPHNDNFVVVHPEQSAIHYFFRASRVTARQVT